VRGSRSQVRWVVAGTGVFALGAALARRPSVGRIEQGCFTTLNVLPAAAYRPAWLVMQAGSLGGVVAASTAAAASGRPGLARLVGVAGAATWAAAKVVKRPVSRGRPVVALGAGTTRVLGRQQRGLGYPSGHAAVAAALCAAARPELGSRGRRAAGAGVVAVGLTRIYVGAHLPLDVVGGVGFGVAAGSATVLVARRRHDTIDHRR
jgi:glycosyltransferase 2 family protein